MSGSMNRDFSNATVATGAPTLSDTFVGSGSSANFTISLNLTAASATVAEVAAQHTILTNVGRANQTTAYKIGHVYGCTTNPSGSNQSADQYAGNGILEGFFGSGGNLGTVNEADCANIGSNADTIASSTSAYGFVSVSAGNARSTAAYWATASTASWNYGFLVSDYASQGAHASGFCDASTSPIAFQAQGTHTTLMDGLASTLSFGVVLPNNIPAIYQRDGGGTLRTAIKVNSGSSVEIGDTGIAGITVNQSVYPYTDNAVSLGAPGFRYTAVYAAGGVITTSDPSQKTDIEDLDDAKVIQIVEAISPKTWRWIIGSRFAVEEEVDGEIPVTEEIQVPVRTVTSVDGRKVAVQTFKVEQRQVYDVVPVVDESGAPVTVNIRSGFPLARSNGEGAEGPVTIEAKVVPQIHSVPRMQPGKVKRIAVKSRPDDSINVGPMATDVKAALDSAGVDWAIYVRGEDGSHNLRPDQAMWLLWRYAQSKARTLTALEARVAKLESRVR